MEGCRSGGRFLREAQANLRNATQLYQETMAAWPTAGAQGDGSRAINGLKELADELAAAADLSNGHADGELADEGLTAEAAELPAGGPASTWGSLRTPTIVGDATGWRATFAGSNGTATDEPEGLVELPPIDPGPMDENEALDRALRLPEVAVELAKLVQLGNATDLEILEILKGWPTHRWTPGASPGQPWATHGDSKLAGPGFFYGHSARIAWPQGPAFLEGGALVKAVRKQLGLKLPRISRAEAKATFDEPAAPAPPAAPMTAREKRNARDRARRAREKGTSVPYVPSGAAVRRSYEGMPAGGWTVRTLDAAARKLVNPGEPLTHTDVCGDCGTIRLTAPVSDAKCPTCKSRSTQGYLEAMKMIQENELKNGAPAPDAPDENVGEWREQTVDVLTVHCGAFSSEMADELARNDFDLLEDVAVALQNGTDYVEFFDRSENPGIYGAALKQALLAYAAHAGWNESTRYPDGIPLEWIEKADDRLDDESTKKAKAPKPEDWTREELHEELRYVMTRGVEPEAIAILRRMTTSGATNDDIMDVIAKYWPDARRFVPAEKTGGKFGCTFQSGSGWACLWMGEFEGPGHKAALANAHLVDAVRSVLDIPRPAISPTPPRAAAAPAASQGGSPARPRVRRERG